MVLARERARGAARKDDLLARCRGRFALTDGGRLLGTSTRFEEAFEAVVVSLGSRSLPDPAVVEDPGQVRGPALAVGALCAHP